ncbi:MAG TPA: AMP-binding protein, partial [Bacteroidia bacterium]|nr:AMP-binding protein [Bacteroidia bacterium]
VFPVNALHQLMDTWPQAKFYNLYGPTETNVCTWYEIPRPYESERIDSYPIGKICSHLEGGMSPEGELLIRGSNVMPGYWQRPELDDISFAIYDEKRYYRTGDRVEMDKNRNYVYTGRLDRMIKKRGYRIEPGEVEVILQHHPDVMEAAVVPAKDEDGHTVLKAVLSVRKGANISVSIIRQYCLPLLPFYMIPERIILQGSLPKTSTGKIDYTQLAGAEQVTR